MTEKKTPQKIGILGPFGFGNMGDAAIQFAMIQHLQARYPDTEIYGYSLNPVDTEERHGIKTFPVTRRPEKEFTKSEIAWKAKTLPGRIAGWFQYNSNPLVRKLERVVVRVPAEFILAYQAFKNIKGLDVLIFSGGGQLDDLWGGPWKHPYVMAKFTLLARLRGIKIAFVSVGVERVETFFGKVFVKASLGRAAYVSYRDRWSMDYLQQNQIDPHPEQHWVYPDLAHSLDIERLNPSGAAAKSDLSGAPVVGINPISYYDPRYWPYKDPEVYQAYLGKMAVLVGWLLEHNYRIKFIRSDIHPDQTAAGDLMNVIHSRGVQYDPAQVIEPNIQTLDELVKELAGIDYLIASRLHSILLAQQVGKPAVALSYQSKIDKLMEDTGQSAYCFSVGEFDPEQAKQAFLKMEANCEQIKAQLTSRTLEYRTALDEQYDRLFEMIEG